MKQKGFILGIITALLVLLVVGGAYYLGIQSRKPNDRQAPQLTPSPTSIVTPQPTETSEETVIPLGWKTYSNSEYGFEISYPGNYQALDDETNLYGWPNGLVLLYKGGQSYDLPIEVWDTASEYENKYKLQMDDLTIKKVGNKYITLLNMNHTEEVDQIITTFKVIE